jgi:uncharacterized protein YjiS (DUF1127 family)
VVQELGPQCQRATPQRTSGAQPSQPRALPVERQGSVAYSLSAPARAIKELILWIAHERRIRRGINELAALDDRMLSDIGVSRGAIEHVARHGRPVTTADDSVRRSLPAQQAA